MNDEIALFDPFAGRVEFTHDLRGKPVLCWISQDWLIERDGWTGGSSPEKCVELYWKYHREIHEKVTQWIRGKEVEVMTG